MDSKLPSTAIVRFFVWNVKGFNSHDTENFGFFTIMYAASQGKRWNEGHNNHPPQHSNA